MAEKKSHPGTRKRRLDARKKGKVRKSAQFTFGIQLAVFAIVAFVGFPFLLRSLHESLPSLVEHSLEPSIALSHVPTVLLAVSALIPVAFVGILIEAWQTGPEVHPPNFTLDKLNPASGLKKMGEGVLRWWRPGLRLFALLAAGGYVVWSFLSQYFSITTAGGITLFASLGGQGLFYTSLTALSIGALDFLLESRDFEAELSMSDDELRREMKEQEGDPWVKSVRRGLHRRMSYEELSQRVRSSRVIIVEPQRENVGRASTTGPG